MIPDADLDEYLRLARYLRRPGQKDRDALRPVCDIAVPRLVEEVRRLYRWRETHRNAYTTVAERAQAYVDVPDLEDDEEDNNAVERAYYDLVEALAYLGRVIEEEQGA